MQNKATALTNYWRVSVARRAYEIIGVAEDYVPIELYAYGPQLKLYWCILDMDLFSPPPAEYP